MQSFPNWLYTFPKEFPTSKSKKKTKIHGEFFFFFLVTRQQVANGSRPGSNPKYQGLLGLQQSHQFYLFLSMPGYLQKYSSVAERQIRMSTR